MVADVRVTKAAPAGSPATRPMAPRRKPDSWKKHWREYLSVSPFFILFLVFGIVPLIYAVQLSMTSWNGLGEPEFVGLEQFERILTGGEFGTALFNTVVIFLMGQIPVIVGALIAAVLLSRPRLRGAGIYQTLYFLPQVTSVVAIAVVFQSLFSDQYGVINQLFKAVGLDTVPWLTTEWGVRFVIALMIVWQSLGYFMVVFLSGLSNIDPSLTEAAMIDGAGGVRRFFSITLPLLRPTIVFVAITGTISGFQLFTQPQVLLNGQTGPGDSGLTIMYLQVLYMGGSVSSTTVPVDLGYAAAVGWAIFAVLLVLAAVNARLLRFSTGR